MKVDCAVYFDSRRETVDGGFHDALERARGERDAFVWIGLYEPTQEEFDLVTAEFDLHPLAVEDAVNAHQRPKLEVYGESLFVVLKTVAWEPAARKLAIGEVMLFLGHRFVVTVRHGSASPLSDVRRSLEDSPDLLRHGPTGVLYAVADRIVDDYGLVVEQLEDEIEQVEEKVFSSDRTNRAPAVYALMREIIAARRAIRPLAEPMTRLAEGRPIPVAEEAKPFFRDVADHVVRVADAIDGFEDLLGSVLNANLAQVSVRQNDDMRRISAWVAIVAVPTMIAGIYGMNFENMPELHWRYGYFVVLAGMATACVLLYRTFKHTGWL